MFVYELANELGIPAVELFSKLKELDIEELFAKDVVLK